MHKHIPLDPRELELLERHNIRYVQYNDEEYPQALREIHCPPPALYVKGASLQQFQKMIAIVGSRKADAYGKKRIDALIPHLVTNQWTIVSGGALGADTMAHHACLQAYGKTIVIFGSGLLAPYPLQNRKLFAAIVEKGGSLVSSFPLTMPPLPHNFPARNRIISGISRGVIVVQAALNSGAAITASFALDQGREVFAIPGNVDNPLSAGCHRLIQQGAKLVQKADDILEEFGEVSSVIPTQSQISENVGLSIEDRVIALCATPKTSSELSDCLNLDAQTVYSMLFNLQIEGKIVQNGAGLFEKATPF